MARREIVMDELVEVLHQWHIGRRISQIKRSLGIARKTIRKYIGLAEGHGFSKDMEVQEYAYYLELAGKVRKGLKTPVDVSPAYKATVVYESAIEKLLSRKYMVAKQVYRILKRDYNYGLSYSSFKRYMNIKYPKLHKSCLRIESGVGEEAQVDFGSAGMMYDPETKRVRRAHAFVMTLSYSRHQYVEFVFDQGQVSWVKCHMHAFAFFGGVPSRVILDNLKSGILKPSTYDPVINRAYGECGKHYGFIIDPAKVRMAAHKGKVERKMPVVRQQFLSSADFRRSKRQIRRCWNGVYRITGCRFMEQQRGGHTTYSAQRRSPCCPVCRRGGSRYRCGRRHGYIRITTLCLIRVTIPCPPDMLVRSCGCGAVWTWFRSFTKGN